MQARRMMMRCVKPAAITSRRVRTIFPVLLLAWGVPAYFCLNSLTVLAQSGSPELRQQKPRVRLTTSVVSQHYCTEIIGTYRETTLRLMIKLKIENLSNEPVIIYRYGGGGFHWVFLSRSIAKAQAGHHVYETHGSIIQADRFLKHDLPEPVLRDDFPVLKPKEAWEYQYQNELNISVDDTSQPSLNLRSGEYFLQVVTQTWSWSDKKAEELNKRWARDGYFWHHDVRSEPMPLRIEKPQSVIPMCKY